MQNLGRLLLPIVLLAGCNGDNLAAIRADAAPPNAPDAKPVVIDAPPVIDAPVDFDAPNIDAPVIDAPPRPDAEPRPDAVPRPDSTPPPDAMPGAPDASATPPTAFRIDSLTILDPHIYYNAFGCTDLTSVANSMAGAELSGDQNKDGYLDFSGLLVMEPLDQGPNASTTGEVMFGNCTAPIDTTTCSPSDPRVSGTINNQSSGTCLAPLAGTTTASYGTITPTMAPCFASTPVSVSIDFMGIMLTLEDAEVAAVYDGDPATGLTSGLIRGFLTEASADSLMFQDPLSGNPIAMSSLLPGGTDCCENTALLGAHSDLDHDANGVPGWYFYINFTAKAVNYTP